MSKQFTLIGPKRLDDASPLWTALLLLEQEEYERGPLEKKAGNQARGVFWSEVKGSTPSKLSPSVVRARCRIKELTLHPPIATNELLINLKKPPGDKSPATVDLDTNELIPWEAGDEVLPAVILLVQPQDAKWNNAILHHGELPLDAVWHARQWQAKPLSSELALPGFDEVRFLRLNADGFSFAASVTLPWRTEKVRARFQLSCPFGPDGHGRGVYRVELDRRDPAPELEEGSKDPAPELEEGSKPGAKRRKALADFADAFNELRALVSSPGASGSGSPAWQALALSTEDIPAFHWLIENGRSVLHLPGTALALQLADGAVPTDRDPRRERRVATLRPEWTVRVDEDGKLVLAAFTDRQPSGPRITWRHDGNGESVTLDDVELCDDPLQTARWVRHAQGLPRPVSLDVEKTKESGPPKADARVPVLTAHTPLADGWAQWPVPNLIQEDYRITTDPLDIEGKGPPLISGVVVYEHEIAPAPVTEPQQNPWSLTVMQGEALAKSSCWIYGKTTGSGGWKLDAAITCVLKPVLAFDGLLWLSAQPPRAEDALPDLADHLAHLRSIPLHAAGRTPNTPSALKLSLEPCVIRGKRDGSELLPGLQTAKLMVKTNPEFSDRATPWLGHYGRAKVSAPLLARHHPSLPCITSLPFWQTQNPPTHPAASRELMMLRPKEWRERWVENEVKQGWLPKPWTFRYGEFGWPAFESECVVSEEWGNTKLPMAVLSVPGLAIDPRIPEGLPESKPFGASGPTLSLQYWHGLPVADQPNALSQRPKDEEEDGDEPRLPGPPRAAPAALTRDTISTHLMELAEKQYRARTEAAECWVNKQGTIHVAGLVDPLLWPVKVEVSEAPYPGKVNLTDTGTGEELLLSKTDALRGLHGGFNIENDLLRLSNPGVGTAHAVEIVAGSMAARMSNNHLMDQRGLGRKSAEFNEANGFVDTPLELLGVKLIQRTLTRPLSLTGADEEWSFLAVGVPLNINTNSQEFAREDTRSPAAEDCNDPGARGAQWNAKAGYHWWLGSPSPIPSRLKLFGLDAFPLALHSLKFEDIQVAGGEKKDVGVTLCLMMRLQLPVLGEPLEQTQRANAVLVTFVGTLDGTHHSLTLVKVEPAPVPANAPTSPAGQWPFSADENGPHLEWGNIRLDQGMNLVVEDSRLEFGLFGRNWSVKVDRITIPRKSPLPIKIEQTIKCEFPGLTIDKVIVILDSVGAHRIEVIVKSLFGRASFLEIDQGYLVFSTDPSDRPTEMSGQLKSPGGFLPLMTVGGATEGLGIQAVLREGELDAVAELQLLPGMTLSAGHLKGNVTGFAATSFITGKTRSTTDGHKLPELQVTTATAEILLPAQWGASLQDRNPEGSLSADSVYGACAGDVYANITTELLAGSWVDKILLNGWIEVKNLVSWPSSLLEQAFQPHSFALTYAKGSDSLMEDGTLPGGVKQTFKDVVEIIRTGRYLLRFEGHAADDTDAMSKNLEVSRSRAKNARSEFLGYLKELEQLGELTREERKRIERVVEQQHLYDIPWPHLLRPVRYGEHRMQRMDYDGTSRDLNRRVELVLRPASVRVPAHNEALDHYRHSIRVLLHQHEVSNPVPGELNSNALFTLGDPWQFLAVTEHEVVKVTGSDPGKHAIQKEDRMAWTATQEIRLAPAKRMASRVNQIASSNLDDPIGQKVNSAKMALHWALRGSWLDGKNGGHEELAKLAPSLLVEASAAFWIRASPAVPQSPTVLQYLPDGTQSGSLLSPEELGGAEQGTRPWHFLCVPFLGRMQSPMQTKAGSSLLYKDPVLTLRAMGAGTPPVVLGLVSRHTQAAWAGFSTFDSSPDHRFERLSEGALQEALLRLQQPSLERGVDPAAFSAHMHALPENSPGRATRPAALEAAFDAKRPSWPRGGVETPVSPAAPLNLEWRKNAWLGQQAVLIVLDRLPVPGGAPAQDITAKLPLSFLLPALHLKAVWDDHRGGRLLAVTALPVTEQDVDANNLPVTLALSPCTQLEFNRPDVDLEDDLILVAFGEVLASNVPKRRLTPVLSTVWIKPEPGNLEKLATTWASESASQLAPESPVLVVRLRETIKRRDQIVVRYRHILAKPSAAAPLPPPGRALRARPERLHFAESQFAGDEVPRTPLAVELAPPLTTGVQPMWSEKFISEKSAQTPFSALRIAVQTVERNGPAIVGSVSANPGRRWWQALWHHAAFDSSDTSRPLLPSKFRAPSRIGLAPAPGELIFSTSSRSVVGKNDGNDWCPILPSAYNALIVGARASAPLAIRPVTITTFTPAEPMQKGYYSSASVPSQHRFPRPVPLPDNESRPDRELQPWASHADPTRNHLAGTEIFEDAAVFVLPKQPVSTRMALSRVLQTGRADNTTDLVREVGQHGGFLVQGMPLIGFEVEIQAGKGAFVDDTSLTCSLGNGATQFAFTGPAKAGKVGIVPVSESEAMQIWLGKLPHGANIQLTVRVPAPNETKVKGYDQALQFPIRVVNPDQMRAALDFHVIHFEDPSYNRTLTSPTAQKAGKVGGQDMILSADRREYNRDSTLIGVLAYSKPSGLAPKDFDLWVNLVGREDGRFIPLLHAPPESTTSSKARKVGMNSVFLVDFSRLSLPDGTPIKLMPRDVVVLQAVVSQQEPIELKIVIVNRDTTPPPQHGYALLHAKGKKEDPASMVRCARFAWNPPATRIELLNPDDLLGPMVRRRAVFRWNDACVSAGSARYAVQKFTQYGATHWPEIT